MSLFGLKTLDGTVGEPLTMAESVNKETGEVRPANRAVHVFVRGGDVFLWESDGWNVSDYPEGSEVVLEARLEPARKAGLYRLKCKSCVVVAEGGE